MTSSVFDRNESSSESPESTTSIGTEKSPISAQMDLRAQQQNSTVLQKKPISGKSQTSDVDHEFLAGSKSAQEPGQSVQIPREPAKREKPIFEQDDRPSSSALPPPPLERSQSNPEETSADPNRYVAADENATVGRFSTPGLPTRSVTGSNPTNALIALSEKNSPNEMAGSIQTPGPVPSSTRKEPPTDVGPKVKNTAYDYVLKAAIRAGNEDRTRELLAENYDVNCEGDYGITPLHTAARYRQEHIVRLLLENGAHPSVKCNKGNTSLHELAFYSGTPLPESLIDLFLQNIPLSDVPNTKGETPLMVAAAFGQEKLATKLIQRGANILAFDVIGRTPLHYAARTGKPDIITLLLKEGALLDQKTTDEDEFTPLQVAASKTFPVLYH